MTISGGGLNINFQQTPSIHEQQTAAHAELQKTADIGKGNVLIVPQSQQDMISFTKMGDRTTWNYKSESGHPSLLPMGVLRGAGPEFEVKDDNWQAFYSDLADQLPDEIKALLGTNTPESKALAGVLELAARALAWQMGAEALSNSENALRRTLDNYHLPGAAFTNAWSIGHELFEATNQLLEEIGPNDPHYGEVKEYTLQAGALLDGATPPGQDIAP